MRIVVTGHKGMLGSVLKELLEERGDEVIGLDLPEYDLARPENFIDKLKDADFVYNCAAFTDVDRCEAEFERAQLINGQLVGELAKITGDTPMLHISTDYVFDGTASVPYKVDNKLNPLSAYGKSKALGEQELIAHKEKYFIVRTAWLYGYHGSNFVETIIKLAGEKDEIKVVNDQLGVPTNVKDLAKVMLLFLDSDKYGIYNYTNSGETTWYDFAKEILTILHINTKVTPCTSEEFVRPAKRPNYSVLDLTKIKNTFNIAIPEWQDSLKKYLAER